MACSERVSQRDAYALFVWTYAQRVWRDERESRFLRPLYSGKAVAETVKLTVGRKGEIKFYADLIRPVKEGKVPFFT